ncbi:MAG TPA: SGNH/GDSL hydrolase family protein [Polyangiaceae bacterium]|nr:SGNH/GDSL hydrolase family protein [Polyangiaceae bacterium]
MRSSDRDVAGACLLLFLAAGCTENSARSSSGSRANSLANSADTGQARPVDHSVRGLIVVLGSSTSAGTGPKQPKNAWVWRYKARLAERFPNVTLVNLAMGGQSTFELQATGYVPPPNRPAPAIGRNITAALALNPNAIIVNLPSNDQANDYPLAEQLANYDRIATSTTGAGVPLWISTTQPRNFNDSGQLDELMRARDAITKKFAPRTLDFWTPFAAPNGFIKPSYDSGDGTHLNDAAHAILASIVEAAHIPEQASARD